MFKSAAKVVLNKPKLFFGVTLGLVGGSVFHRKFIRFDKNITVKHTYPKTEDGNTLYMIVDSKGDLYKVENSIWWTQYNRAEEWAKIDKDKSYRIRGSGIRNGYMGWYPRVYRAKEIHNMQ